LMIIMDRINNYVNKEYPYKIENFQKKMVEVI
jgi:hypothetical protein